MDIEDNYKPVIHIYVKQRIFISMKYSNYQLNNLIAKKSKITFIKTTKIMKDYDECKVG